MPQFRCERRRFNTQPPEGGWIGGIFGIRFLMGFNTQPPEGGWFGRQSEFRFVHFSFNTQPPEGGWKAWIR